MESDSFTTSKVVLNSEYREWSHGPLRSEYALPELLPDQSADMS
jgi:hypothetical protein